MKILHVGPLPPPVGGMASVVEGLTGALARFGDVRILNTVKTTRDDRSVFEGVFAQLRLLGRLAQLCVVWRPQAVHVHTCSWFSFWRSAVDVVLARLLGRAVLLHIHGGQFEEFLDSLPPFKARLARLVFAACSSVIVLGEGWKALLDRWCNPAKVIVVPNGVELQPQQVLGGDGDFTVICLGAYGPGKGQAELLRAVAALRGERRVRVALLGPEGRPGQHKALQRLADELGLADRADIPGPVFGVQKDAWWALADCFCLPSYNEGLPMAMLEAMARGVPVVMTRVGAIPEAVADGEEALLCNAGDVAGLTAQLQSLLDDPALAARIGRAGRERLIRSFTLDSSARRVMSLYKRLA